MDEYIAKDLQQDTKDFLGSQYGQYVTVTLSEIAEAYLSSAQNIEVEHPERYLAKYSAIKEVLTFINQPLDNDKSTRG